MLKMHRRIGRIATGLALVVGTTLTTASGVAIHANTARATVTPGPNPWNYQMTNPNDYGMVIKGTPNSLAQIFQVRDPYGAPIFSVGHVGGAGVFGDRIAVFPPTSVTSPVIVLDDNGRISITGPSAGVWIDGQLLTSDDIAWIHSQRGVGANGR
jgi:hypothetical protein